MVNSITQPSDVADRWRPLEGDETKTAETRIADAERLIRKRFRKTGRDFDAEVAANTDDFVDDVKQVVSTAVIRVLQNPEGKRAESIDDYSYTRDRAGSDGQLRLTAEEWAILGVTAPVKATKAFSIDTTPPAARRPAYGRFR